jgi:hypothetical protein
MALARERMPDFPLHTDSNGRHRTFIIVAAWFFTMLGAWHALKTAGRLIISYWTVTYGSLGIVYAVGQFAELLFAIAAVIVGLGMLNQRTTALRNGIFLLWFYFYWTVAGIVWGIIEFAKQAAILASLTSGQSEIVQKSNASALAYFAYGTIFSVLSCVVCFWLARRLSLPVIKAVYAK